MCLKTTLSKKVKDAIEGEMYKIDARGKKAVYIYELYKDENMLLFSPKFLSNFFNYYVLELGENKEN